MFCSQTDGFHCNFSFFAASSGKLNPREIKSLPPKNTWTFYDVEADVLYINFHQPALAADDSELTEDGILVRYQNDEIIGLTILNVSKQSLLESKTV